jgi:hypothetical protein
MGAEMVVNEGDDTIGSAEGGRGDRRDSINVNMRPRVRQPGVDTVE